MRLRFCGYACLFDATGSAVFDPAVLEQLHGHKLDEYSTDYLGDTGLEGVVLEALERSGTMWFEYVSGLFLRVYMEFIAKRKLADEEVELLRKDTLGQWSDGMGENVWIESGPLTGYKLQPLDEREAEEPDYPAVEWID